jgi:uncharacterized repeat protein (TIGR01451 family)
MGNAITISIRDKRAAVCFVLLLLFASWIPAANAQTDPDLQNPPANLEDLPSGSLVVPMDHLLQDWDGNGYFNNRAYGLINRWLQAEIPVKWVINSTKTNIDDIDFTADVARVRPTPAASATVDFRGGAFVVVPNGSDISDALSIADNASSGGVPNFFDNVVLYTLDNTETDIDVRYTLTFKPKISVSGDNFGIHAAILDDAGFEFGTHYFEQFASALPGECFTYHSEPHTSPSESDVIGLNSFLELGGNALLQCEAAENYENYNANGVTGGYQTSNGITSNGSTLPLIYRHPDLAYSQFTGVTIAAGEGGSVPDWVINGGEGNYINNGFTHADNGTGNIQMSQAKLNGPGALGSNIFYLGGHQYDDNNITGVNGQRVFLNTIFVPSQAVNCPQLFFYNLNGTVFYDENNNGLLDGAETGYPGITVTLTGPNSETIVVTTDQNGFYSIGIPTSDQFGNWTVTVTVPGGTSITTGNQGQTVNVDENSTPETADPVGLGAQSAMTIVKSNNPDINTFVSAGETITYTVIVENTGGTVLTGVDLSDPIPSGTTFVNNSVSAAFTTQPSLSTLDPFRDYRNLTKVEFTTPGSFTWSPPAGVTEVVVEVWGAGGSTDDGNDSRGGAGGGAYARSILTVNPATTYDLQVGDGPTQKNRDGEDSWFISTSDVFAEGGKKGGDAGGAGGLASNSIGDVTYSGGDGGARSADKDYGGGGGGSARTNGDGNNGTPAVDGGPAGVGGAGTGDGGDGGAIGVAGEDGQAPGGGGGGTGSGVDDVSAGGDGQVNIYYIALGTTDADNSPNDAIASGWTLIPGATLEFTFEVTVDDPATEFQFLNSATVSTDQLPDIESNEVQNQMLAVTTGSCWRTLSSPVSGQTYAEYFASFQTDGTDFGGLWTQGVTGARHTAGTPNVYTMDGTGSDWVAVPNLSDPIPAGTGILISIFDEDEYQNPASAGFPKIASISGTENSPLTVDLGVPNGTTASNGDDDPDFQGFSMLGNPFFAPISFAEVFSNAGTTGIENAAWVYDRNAGGWRSTNGSGVGDIAGGIIAPGQGFVVQNSNPTSNPEVQFQADDKTTGSTFYGKLSERTLPDHIRLELRGEDVYSSAWIQFSNDGTVSERTDGDVLQFYPFESEYAVLSSVKQGQLMDIGHFPYPEEEDLQIPLTVESTSANEMTLELTNLQYNGGQLYLHDTETGESVELTEGATYTFTPSGTLAKSLNDCFSTPVGFLGPERTAKQAGPRFFISSQVSTDIGTGDLPGEYKLEQNYPNPFNPSTQITYQLPVQSDVRLQVFDMAGRQVATLVSESVNAGTHTVSFDATNLSSGVYMYRLQAGSTILTKKLTLIK